MRRALVVLAAVLAAGCLSPRRSVEELRAGIAKPSVDAGAEAGEVAGAEVDGAAEDGLDDVADDDISPVAPDADPGSDATPEDSGETATLDVPEIGADSPDGGAADSQEDGAGDVGEVAAFDGQPSDTTNVAGDLASADGLLETPDGQGDLPNFDTGLDSKDTVTADVPVEDASSTSDVAVDVGLDLAAPQDIPDPQDMDTDTGGCTPIACDDGNTCTADACKAGGCEHTPADGACDDGNACTIGDKCGAGSCQPGTALACSDGVKCTSDDCSPTSGCVFNALPGYAAPGCSCATGYVTVQVKNGTVCSPDIPVWGIRPESPPAEWFVEGPAGVVTDTQTKLLWEKVPSSNKPWPEAAAYCNSLTLAGKADWRLPTVAELETLEDFAKKFPAVPTIFTAASGPYWTATGSAGDPGIYWLVWFNNGGYGSNTKDHVYGVRCVAGASSTAPVSPAGRFLVQAGKGIVLDSVTKLAWQHDGMASGTKTWSAAESYCKNLALDGGGWRLPTIVELRSILDRTTALPAIDTKAFPSTANSYYWASTVFSGAPDGARWNVQFGSGYSGDNGSLGVGNAHHVRCVR